MNREKDNIIALFNTIPPVLWRGLWQDLQSTDALRRISALYFWIGIYSSAGTSDRDFCDKKFLADMALRLCIGEVHHG